MSKVTIFTIVAFFIALFSFLVYDYIEGTIQDTMVDVTGQVVKDTNIDDSSKGSLLGTLSTIKMIGIFGTIGGVILLIKKFF